ncbi:MAG: methionyl-tRNA formyltransferase [Bacteroidales bacterium]|nr:methionyl-tRNA formyltransferase [Bacteroidales bacterium]
MKKIDKFILTSFVGPFFMILLVVIFILMMQTLWVYIDELVGKGLDFKVIAEFLFWGSCTILPLALPLATLLASMMTIGNMGENNELIALKAAGVSVSRVMAPVMIASVFISIGTYYAINELVPVAFNQIYTLRDDIKRTKNEIKIPDGVFYDGVDGFVLRVENTNQRGVMNGVMLYDHHGKGNTRLTIADSAEIRMSKDKSYLTIKMYDGTNYQETNEKEGRKESHQLQRINFSKQEMVVTLENYAFQKSDSARFGDQVRTLPQWKLKEDKVRLENERDSVKAMQLMSTAASYLFTLRSQLDTTSSGISRNFEDDGFLDFKDDQTTSQAYERAASTARQFQSNIESYEFGAFDYTVKLRLTFLELLRRYGQAIACFIMFFIGAPLGALIRKGGLGVSAIVAILFFVLYYIVDITGVKLARDGSVSAWVGAFASSVVMLVIGIYLTTKAIHDTDMSNFDSMKNWWRKFKSTASGFFRKTRIVYMGTPEFAVAPLKELLDKKYNVVAVVTVADKPSGRGQKVNESAVKKFASERGIPVLQPVKLKDPDFLARLKALKADLFIVVAFRMLPEEVWSMPRLGTFNLHASLLPQYRGAAPINWAVINGESRTGATTFMIDKQIDTGGIILRQDILIGKDDTAGDIHDKLMEIGAEMVAQTAQGLIEKNVETRVQRSFIQGSEVLKPAPKLTRELCHIDWNDSTRQIHNLIRGLSPYPAAFTELTRDGSAPVQLKIYSAEPVTPGAEGMVSEDHATLGTVRGGTGAKRSGASGGAERSEASEPPYPPLRASHGKIVSDGKTYMWITTADGAISLKEVQLAGKKRMGIEAFLLGFRDPGSYSTTPGSSKAEIAKTKPAR